MKFVFFGYDFSLPVLKRLTDDGHAAQALYTFKCDNVFNFNRDIKAFAQKNNAPISMKKPTADDIKQLINQDAELFLSCGYPYKIPDIDETKAYGVNTHPSLLPRGRGLMPSPHIIMNEPEIAGFTIHKITNEYDAGDILYQEKIELDHKSTVDSYSAEIGKRTPGAISDVVKNLPARWKNATPQDQSLATTITPPTTQMRTINWSDTVDNIDRIGRAFGSFGSIAKIEDKTIAIFAYKIEKTNHNQPSGKVIKQNKDEIKITALDGFITLTKFMIF